MIKLSEISTLPPEGLSKEEAKKITNDYAERLAVQQNLLIGQGKYSLLVVFQGMDGSGKDGAVKKVFKDCYHTNISVYSFKKPTPEEFGHDFLWRVHKQCPGKGQIKIFNRSHYEDILIQRVHGWIDEERVEKRMTAINAFEELLEFDNDTIILKFYLHLSKEQQALELRERIDDPTKHWKHNDGDWDEREHWEKYRKCYEYAINNSKIPWTIVPVDKRWYRDLVVAKTITEKLESLNMKYPELETERF